MLEYGAGGSPVQRQNKIVSCDSANKSQLRSGQGAACPTRYLEPDVYKQVKLEWQLRLIVATAGQQRNARIPKSNRMPDAPHSVKVETQVVDSIEDLSQNFIRRINVPQVRTRIALAYTA